MTLAEPVARCGFRLTELAEELELAAARAAVAVPAGWLGIAGAHYRDALSDCERDVRTVASAYGTAGDVLLPYARALLEVEALEQQAARLRDLASTETAVAALTGGIDEGAPLLLAADRLQEEARAAECAATARCAAQLHELATRAPRARRSTSTWRFISDAASVGVGAVAGAAAVASAAVRALGGERAARHELAEQALAMMRIWETPVQMWHDLLDGRPGLVLGAAPFLGRLPKGVIRDPHSAHVEALRERATRDATPRYPLLRLTPGELAVRGASLLNEDARGGHTRLKHAGASLAYLRSRNAEGVGTATSFISEGQAQALVNAVLFAQRHELPKVLRLLPGRYLPLEMRFMYPVGYGTLRRQQNPVACLRVRVVIGLEEGQPYVHTAYPLP